MFRTKTVFVVGAGASCELKFPSGAELLSRIADALNIRFRDGSLDSGDTHLLNAFEQIVSAERGQRADINPYLHAGWRVRGAAHLGLSIDNVINQFDDDPLVALAGKLAIARQILVAERNSALFTSKPGASDEILFAIRGTWLGAFAQLLVQDKVRSNVENIFENVSVISFNYDRSVRHFLPLALMSQFGLDEPTAQQLAATLPIFHPYGSLGPLGWESASGGVEYGASDHASLIDIAGRLRTFTEQIEDSDELAAMRSTLSQAARVIFLGFGYHRQNLTLLTNDMIGSAQRVYGTALGLSDRDSDVVVRELSTFLREHYRGHFDPELHRVPCEQFLREHFRALTA